MVRLYHNKATQAMQCESLNSKTDGNVRLSSPSYNNHSNYSSLSGVESKQYVDTRVLNFVNVTPYGFLAFSSRENYDAILNVIKDYDDMQMDAWEKSMGFVSAYTTFANPEQYNERYENNLNSLFEDEFLLRIIDKYGIIQIGPYVFKLETNDYYVLEINAKDLANHYGTFRMGRFDPLVMNSFDTLSDIDVFDVLDTGTIGNGKPKMGGGKGKPGTPDDPRRIEQIFTNKESFNYDEEHDYIYRAQVKASYQTGLIYYSLITALHYKRKAKGGHALDGWSKYTSKKMCFVVGPVSIETTYIPFKSFCKYKRRGSADWHFPTVPHQNLGGALSNTNLLHWRAYEGSRRVELYEMNIMFAFQNYADYWKALQVRIAKTW